MTLTSILEFHDATNPLPFDIFEDANIQFGKITVKVPEISINPFTWDVKFSIDASQSMRDLCKDGKTKIEHIKYTMTHILKTFVKYAEPNQDLLFNVCIHTFNDTNSEIFDFIHLTPENLDYHIDKINEIIPDNSTNLLLPITVTNEQMQLRENEFPNHKRLHILLTDGQDTSHNSSSSICAAVNSTYDFIVFGFGNDHDSQTLRNISQKPRCDYGFIDEMERAGLVYGEYLHNVLYAAYENVTIQLENASIYDWKTNQWSPSINIPNLASGLTKTYYVKTTTPDELTGTIYGTKLPEYTNGLLDHIELLPALLDGNTNEIQTTNLLHDMFRLKTMELLFSANHQSNNYSDIDDDVSPIKQQIRTFFNVLKTYMKDNDCLEEPLLKTLLDDLYVTYKTMGTRNFELYGSARQRSQGRQNVCTATQLDDDDATEPFAQTNVFTMTPMRLRRQPTISRIPGPLNLHIVSPDEMGEHILSQTQSNYASPSVTRLMREMSGQ
jgi:uncharacterized protein YegL